MGVILDHSTLTSTPIALQLPFNVDIIFDIWDFASSVFTIQIYAVRLFGSDRRFSVGLLTHHKHSKCFTLDANFESDCVERVVCALSQVQLCLRSERMNVCLLHFAYMKNGEIPI